MSRPGFNFMICPDAEILRRMVSEALAEHWGDNYERRVFWGDDETLPPEFWAELTTPSLLGTNKVLLVRRANKLKAEDFAKLVRPLGSKSSTIWPIFCLEGEWSRKGPSAPAALSRKKYYQVAQERGWVRENPGLTRKDAQGFVRTWLDREGLKASPEAVRTLAQALPLDGSAASLELDKIALAVGEDRTVAPELARLVAPHDDMDLFGFFEELSRRGGSAQVWSQVLKDHSKSESMIFGLVGYTARQARQYALLLAGEQDKVKLPPFIKNKLMEQARRLGPAGVVRLFELSLEAELAVKSGRLSQEQSLETLVAGLAAAFSRS
ncbi:MAG: polymerase subunit delta [Desulfovibrionales bacterium]|jgi:DNA polymerase-3 subunit delta|nr:polymerase subunit delta [Desulfovibrionales bacterium]